MTVVAYWRTGNTNPPIVIPLYLGTDPLTGEVREIAGDDAVTLIMRNGDATVPAAQVRGPLDLVTFDEPRTDPDTGAVTSQGVVFQPEDGDFDEDGTYEVVFDRTTSDDRVETIPDRVSVSYQFLIGAKPGDEDA